VMHAMGMTTEPETTESRLQRIVADVEGISPLDRLVWPAETVAAPRYGKPKFGARALAYVIDLCVCFVPLFTSLLLFYIWTPLGMIATPAAILWAILYGFTKDGRKGGQSIGKELLDLMVVNITTNRPCTQGESALRQLDLCFLQMIPIVGWLVEPIVMLVSKDGRRLGDRAAKTQVIEVSEYRPRPPAAASGH